ncbi:MULTISPECIES: hypothetical protein [unclassified Streptomyces]|nr:MULTISPECIES: hypothetical protein [unclassified Streptomyces]SCF80109.1 hypothetical protein GA0115259_102803 [Streptomyces sp. MnatMP-M17]
MQSFARVPLEGGSSVLFEVSTTPDGPVKAGRLTDAIHDLPGNL